MVNETSASITGVDFELRELVADFGSLDPGTMPDLSAGCGGCSGCGPDVV